MSEASVSEAVTDLASESCELQPKRSFPTKAVVLALCSALAVMAVVAVRVPSGQVNVMDDSLIDLAEAKKKQDKKNISIIGLIRDQHLCQKVHNLY